MSAPLSPEWAQVLVALGDDHLILGHRVSEWCGHAPMLEEDLSLPNIGLDLIGCARGLYALAAEVEGEGRTEDQIAYLRTDREYRNVLLVERPNGDFAQTMLRQLLFSAWAMHFWQASLGSAEERFAAIAGKAVKEATYHVRHSGEWVVRMADGTEESRRRIIEALDDLFRYTNELFAMPAPFRAAHEHGLLPDGDDLRAPWNETIEEVFGQGYLTVPEIEYPQRGGREGLHTEAMGFLLADLQYMQRTYPGMEW